MVSDSPLPDRCGARVVDKVGLEISLEGTDQLTDTHVDAVRLVSPDGQTAIDAVPNYTKIREYLWDDYELTLVGTIGDIAVEGSVQTVDPSAPDMTVDVDTADIACWLDVGDLVTNVTNGRAELQGFCERYPMTDEESDDRCYVHQGGGAPEGNTNRMTHGMYAQRTSFYQQLDHDDKAFVESMVDDWLDHAPFDRDSPAMVNELYRCAIDQLRAWAGIDEFVEDGTYVGLTQEMVIGTDDEGEPIHAEDEHPANMPYSRLDKDVRSKLKELGIYESPDKQQADATKSLAQKLSERDA